MSNRTFYCAFLLSVIVWFVIVWTVTGLITASAQTRIPAGQLRDVNVSPIAGIERTKCDSSGQSWNCAGLQMLRMTLTDGTVIGPFVLIKATPEILAKPQLWQAIPLAAE